MAVLRQFHTNFSGGELSPFLSSRIDTGAYANGADRLRNVLIKSQGGVIRRPGMEYLFTLDLPEDTRFQTEPYHFDEDESYLLIFSAGRIDIIDELFPDQPLTPITGAPWTADEIGQIIVAESGDTMIITHFNFKMQVLTRTSATTFSLSDFVFDEVTDDENFTQKIVNEPFYRFAGPDVLLTKSSATGSGRATMTASAPSFTAEDDGTVLWLTDPGTGSEDEHDHVFKIDNFISSTVVEGTISGAINDGTEMIDWLEGVFSNRRGWARSVTFHDQRLIFGGSTSLPNFLFMSKVGIFFNFNLGEGLDTDGIQVQIAENRISEIKSMSSFHHLVIFTSEQEMFVPTNENNPVSPSNISIRKQTSHGVSPFPPHEFDGGIIYLTKSGGSLREFVFSDISQGYDSNIINIVSEHLVRDVVDMDTQQDAPHQQESIFYVVNDDGTMAVFSSIRKEELSGWSLYETEGKFLTVTEVNRQMYHVVERMVDSEKKFFVEKESFGDFLDSAAFLTSETPTKSWSVPHLPNSVVWVKAGLFSLGSFITNESGHFETDTEHTDIEVGFNFVPIVTTLPPELDLADGTTVGKPRRIVSAIVDVLDSLDVEVEGTEILSRNVNDDFSLEPTLVTGKKEVYFLGWGNEGKITITQRQPLPFKINGVLLKVDF